MSLNISDVPPSGRSQDPQNIQGNVFTNYYNQIPNNTGRAVLQASAVSFVISTIIEGDPVTGLANAALSATATTNYALVSPIFRYVIGSDRQLTWGEEMLRGCVSYVGAGSLALAAGSTVAIESISTYAFVHAIRTSFGSDEATRNLNHTAPLGMYSFGTVEKWHSFKK